MRIAKRFLPLFVLLAVPLAAASCRALLKEAFRPPKVRVTEVTLTSDPRADPAGPWTFLLALAVDNPNGYPLNVVHLAYSAIIGGDTIAEEDRPSDIRIEASRVTEVTIPLTVRPDVFQDAMRRLLSGRRLDYEFNGSISLQAPLVGVVRVPFSKTGTVDPVELLRKKGFGVN